MSGINILKLSHGGAVAVLRHNARVGRRHSNPDIDPAKTPGNTLFTMDGQTAIERFAERTEEVKANKPKGRRRKKDMVELVSLVFDLPEDFPNPDDRQAVDAYFRRCLDIQAEMFGGWENFCGAQVHRDEVHEYTVSPSVLTAEGIHVEPGDPPVRRLSRQHMHSQSMPIVSPEQIESINGKAKRSRSKKGRRTTGVWFDADGLITRTWLKTLNARIQKMSADEFDCHYQSRRASYSSSCEVEQLKLESRIEERAQPQVEATIDQAREKTRAVEALSRAQERREAAFDEHVREWETVQRLTFLERLRAWLCKEIALARRLFARARSEGYADGYRAGVERGIQARGKPSAPAARESVSDAQLRAVDSLKRQLATDPGLIPSHRHGRRYTLEEWAALPPVTRRFLLSQGIPDPTRGRPHDRSL